MTTAPLPLPIAADPRLLIDYLREQRRHYLALAEAAQRMIAELEKNPPYNRGIETRSERR